MSASLEDGTSRRYFDLSTKDVEWLESSYGKGNMGRIMGLLLAKFREVHTKTPQELASIGAEAIKKMIGDGEVEIS